MARTKKKTPERSHYARYSAAIRRSRLKSALRTRHRYDVLAALKRVEGAQSLKRSKGDAR